MQNVNNLQSSQTKQLTKDIPVRGNVSVEIQFFGFNLNSFFIKKKKDKKSFSKKAAKKVYF